MPRYAQFYSATEAEAATSLSELCPRQSDAPHFSSDNTEQLESIINGALTISSRARNDVNQPLFRSEQAKSVEELFLSASGFNITHETVYRDKVVYNDSTSEDSAGEWKTRSRTPSSDEPSPRKRRAPVSTLSVKAVASSDGSDDEMAHVAQRTQMKQFYNRESFPDHYAPYPDNVLQNMDTQFSKWSYGLDEGKNAVPFVMVQAPTDTHESLVKVDREFWITGDESAGGETGNRQGAANAVLERAQKKSTRPINSSKQTGAPKLKSSGTGDTTPKENAASKRAALIAKGKAAKDSSLVVSKSANQRRSAMHKNKHRRSIMPSPPPIARKPEPVKTQEVQTEESRPTVIILDRKEDDQRRELGSALQNGSLDWNNDKHLEALMQRLRSTGTDTSEAEAQKVGQVGDNNQVGKTRRLKGKAKKKAKSGDAR